MTPVVLATQEAEIGRIQLKSTPTKYLLRPYLKKKKKKKPSQKRAGGVAQGVAPEFKPQYCKKIKNFLTFLK
jgi:hypothetical protein